MRIKSVLSIIFSLIYLPYGLFYSIIELFNTKKYACFLFSFLMALLGYLLVPYESWDLVRHYEAFEVLKGLTFAEMLNYGHIRYLPLHFYMWCLSSIGIDKAFLPFFSLFFSYLLCLLILQDIMKVHFVNRKGVYSKIVLLSVLVMLTIIPFIGIASSLRQYLAISIFLYIVYNYSRLGKVFSLLFFCLTVLVHMSTLPVIFLFYLSRTRFFNKCGFYVLSISFIFVVTGFYSSVFFFITDYFKPYLDSNGLYFPLYMNPDTINAIKSAASFNEMILKKIISPAFFYIFALISIFFSKDSDENDLRPFLSLLMVFISFISVAPDPFSRYSVYYTMIYFVVFFRTDYFKLNKNGKKMLFITLLCSLTVFNIAKLNSYKLIFYPSWYEVLYVPIPLLFLKQVEIDNFIKVE